MKEVFADTHYFIALLNRHDQFHAAAMAASSQQAWRLTTTLWVLAELADALRSPSMRFIADQFIRAAVSSTDVLVVTEAEHWFTRGLDLYGQRRDKAWSLTDCISFEVMKARGIEEALTGDHHFAQAGFRPLLSLPAV